MTSETQSDGQGDGTPSVTLGEWSSSNWTNSSSIDLYILANLGPKRWELYKVIPVTIIYCIIFVTGIVGNVSTCIVIARNKYMQTATNYYLFNLAVADLLVLVLGLPLETYSFWQAYPWIFGEAFCLIRTMAAETSTYASILTITAFTVERYVAICHPMRAHSMSSLKRAVKVIILIWIFSTVCSIPMVVQFGVVYLKDPNGVKIAESATCQVDARRYVHHVFEMATFLFFLTPMTMITVLYAMIGLAIKRSTLARSSSNKSMQNGKAGRDLRHQQQTTQARLAVLKMLVAVVVAFFICWAPFHLQRLMVIYIKKSDWNEAMTIFQNTLFYVSGILYFVSSTINPILYNIMSLKFRQAFKSTIFSPCRRKRKHQHTTYRFSRKHGGLGGATNVTLVHGQHLLQLKRLCKSANAGLTTVPRSNSGSTLSDRRHEAIELEPVVEYESLGGQHRIPKQNNRPYHSCS